MKLFSTCCGARVRTVGDITKHYECCECGLPTDADTTLSHRAISRRGGSRRSAAKTAACRRNWKKAMLAIRKQRNEEK